MSETFSSTRVSIRKLKAALREADEDTRYAFAFWIIGLATMASAIIIQFGWPGTAFCVGFVMWAVSDERT